MDPFPSGPHKIVVHAHGQVGTADHVYAHDQIARLHQILTGRTTRCVVDLVDHGNGGGCSARADLEIDGTTIQAHARGATVRIAVDRLEVELRRRLAKFGRETSSSTSGRRQP